MAFQLNVPLVLSVLLLIPLFGGLFGVALFRRAPRFASLICGAAILWGFIVYRDWTWVVEAHPYRTQLLLSWLLGSLLALALMLVVARRTRRGAA